MSTLERWRYGDPAIVAERAEQQSCKGCWYAGFVEAFGVKFPQCAKGRVFGKRCKFYKEKT